MFRAALPPHHCASFDVAVALQQLRRARAALAGREYLFLAQTVKQSFLLQPKANVDQSTGFPRAERGQAGREAADTLGRETKGDSTEVGFCSPTQHTEDKRRAWRDTNSGELISMMEAVPTSSQMCSQQSKEQPHTATGT